MNITLCKTVRDQTVPIIAAPPSKSDAHRLLILSALSDTRTPIFISCRGTNDDMDATVRCLRALGADINRTADGYTILPIDRTADRPTREIPVNVGESGSTLRFLIPILGALGIPTAIRREGRLPQRPLSPLDDVLMSHGMTLYDDPSDPACLHVSGRLTAGAFSIDGSISSQFITGLLFALPMLDLPSTLRITGEISSAPYLCLTQNALARFGFCSNPAEQGHLYEIAPAAYHPCTELQVEGDWSGASFLLCAGAVADGVTVTGLSEHSSQGDKRILEVLNACGCKIEWQENAVSVIPPDDKILRPISIHADDIPDLVPPIALLCCAADGTSEIRGCSRLRIKESDRLAALVQTITALGGNAETDGDTLKIYGTATLHGGSCEGFGDHRMVMSAALAALISAHPVTVSDRDATGKSYPDFFEDFSVFGITDAGSFR